MRILFFCPHHLWPLNSGARLRNFHLAKALARECPVTLLQLLQPREIANDSSLATSFERVLSFRKHASYTPDKILRGLIGPLPLTVLNYYSPAVSKELSELLEHGSFDAVQLESIHLFKYLEVVRNAPTRPAILMDWHNIESELMWRYAEQTKSPPKRIIARRTAQLLEQVELQALGACDLHTVVSEREKAELLERCPSARVHLIPNGVDTEFYSSAEIRTAGTRSRRMLLFVGSMDYHANIDAVTWFVREVWPMLLREFPELEFTVAGRDPPASVRALASSRVHITGTVDDVRPFYADAFAVVVPLRVGGGTRLKILEAMAAGAPVISTSLGAEGLVAKDSLHLLLADSPEQIGGAIRSLRDDDALRLRLIDAARALVTEQYDWAVLGRELSALYSGLLARRAG